MRVQHRALAILWISAFVFLPASLRAHAHLTRSEPASGTVLSAPPKTLRLFFSERVEAHLTHALLVRQPGDTLRLSGFSESANSASTVEAAIPVDLLPGDYAVYWSCIGVDGHAIHGSYSFRVSPNEGLVSSPTSFPVVDTTLPEGPLAAATEHIAPQDVSSSGGVAGAIARIGTFAGMLLLLGAIVFRSMILPRASLGEASAMFARRLAWYGVAGTLIVLVFTGMRLIVGGEMVAANSEGAALAPLQLLTETRWGSSLELLAVACAIALVGFFLARRVALGWVLAGLGGVTAAWALALSGHAATVERFPKLALAMDTVHVVAVSSWIGGLFLLIATGVRSTRSSADPGRWTRLSNLVRAFTPVAMVSMATLVLTGLFSGWMQVKTMENLFSSTYGRVLLLKLGLFALTALIGAYNYRVVTPRLATEAGTLMLQRSARAELTIAIGILIVTGILTGLSTL